MLEVVILLLFPNHVSLPEQMPPPEIIERIERAAYRCGPYYPYKWDDENGLKVKINGKWLRLKY